MPVKDEVVRALCLPSGDVAIIDVAEWLRRFTVRFADGHEWSGRPCDLKWFAAKDEHTTYVRATTFDDGQKRTIALHRLLTQCDGVQIVDHENGNGLDNRRSNLRICSQQSNRANSRPSTKRSLPKGVSVHKKTGKFQATIGMDYKKIHIGLYATAEEAAMAYDAKSCELFGEFAKLNEKKAEQFHGS